MTKRLSIPKICLKSIIVLSFASLAVLLIFYIIQVSYLAKTRFEVSSHKKEIAQLLQNNKNLELYYSQENSFASLDRLLENSDYVKVDKVHYIQVLDEVVAVR